ncbi:glycoside hydrolase family 125 protein [Nitrospirillum viridazoti]|uniref:glycoside hydrolase family 125 protein n=1 Tax=Nitrospirillum viridazoti TaxID=3144925 RepID=UPI0011ADA011|nr:glycoside hydrolase family 125 protein [Nitrospirillum amazonense]TWB29205.1 hypothetical protein FBZ91_12725 [Nitrospirillum amazonense]
MISRRDALWGLAGGALIGAFPAGHARAAPLASRRPPPAQRKVSSPAVERELARVKAAIADPELAWLFENCFPNTLDTTVELGRLDGKADSFVITGDIECLWLRDSSAQVWPYLPLARNDAVLRQVFQGLIHRQARCILIDPYANAFLPDPKGTTPNKWAVDDLTDMKPGVAERKWEIDSLCYPIRLAHGYWRATGDVTPFDKEWRAATRLVVATLRQQQRKDGPGPYRFQRKAETPTETLALDGYGFPTRKVGMIHAMFRPSDDACLYAFNIPGNLFAVAALRLLVPLWRAVGGEEALAQDALALAAEVETAVHAHGRMADAAGQDIWAYEVDGFGNRLFMDDANVPSLLGLPYLGCCAADDPLYRRTRARVWSDDNPYFFQGTAGEGVGGPHEGLRMIWPMAIIVRALTSDDDAEIRQCLAWLKATHAGTGFMHEAFDQDDPTHFTRSWFAWANTLFGELMIDLLARKPALLRAPVR